MFTMNRQDTNGLFNTLQGSVQDCRCMCLVVGVIVLPCPSRRTWICRAQNASDEHGSDRPRQQLNQNPDCLAGDSSGLIERRPEDLTPLQVAHALRLSSLQVQSLEFRAN